MSVSVITPEMMEAAVLDLMAHGMSEETARAQAPFCFDIQDAIDENDLRSQAFFGDTPPSYADQLETAKSLLLEMRGKFNTAHDEHGRFARSSASAPWSASTEAPKGLTHATAKEMEDATALGHITRSDDVFDTQVRGAAKNALVSQISARIIADPKRLDALGFSQQTADVSSKVYDRVNRVIGGWAGSSGDTDKQALAMQRAISEEFGVHKGWKEIEDRAKQEDPWAVKYANDIHKEHGAGNRAIVRTMYENTQEQLAKEGVSSVTLYRGVHFTVGQEPKWAKYGYRDNIALQPASSFTPRLRTAMTFSGVSNASTSSHVIAMEVPRERILGTARTGFGCLSEYEYVVLGGTSPGRNLKVGGTSSQYDAVLKPPGKEGY